MMRYSFILFISCLLSLNSAADHDVNLLFNEKHHLTLDQLVIHINGYPVPTRDAFTGWLIFNQAEAEFQAIIDAFEKAGITHEMPLYLVLLQGTNWRLNGKSVFVMPQKKYWHNMINTVLFIERYLMPEIGALIPVSGDRTREYNAISGGASSSKHLQFCALDLVPVETISRDELHRKLKKIHRETGKEFNIGLGLYRGVRFHIDSCGFRHW